MVAGILAGLAGTILTPVIQQAITPQQAAPPGQPGGGFAGGGGGGGLFGGGTTGGQEQYLIATYGTGDQGTIRQRLAGCGVQGAQTISLTLPLAAYNPPLTRQQALLGCGVTQGFGSVPPPMPPTPVPPIVEFVKRIPDMFQFGGLIGEGLVNRAFPDSIFQQARRDFNAGSPVTLGDLLPASSVKDLLRKVCFVSRCNPTVPAFFTSACDIVKPRSRGGCSTKRSCSCGPRSVRISCGGC